MSNKAFSLVSGSCKLATRCSIFNAWLFDEDVLLELLVCCCCAACAAIIIACTNRPIDWKRFDALCAKCFSNTSRTNIDRIRAEFSSKHKRLSLLSHYTKEYKSSSLLSFSSVAVVVVVAESCSSLFHLRCRDHLWGNVERIFLKRKERCALCCVVSVVVSQTVAAFDTKNKEERKRAGFTESALISPPLSCFCRRVFLLPRGVFYWCIRFVSRGGCAQSMLERGEEDSFPLRGRRRGCDFWSHSSSERQF